MPCYISHHVCPQLSCPFLIQIFPYAMMPNMPTIFSTGLSLPLFQTLQFPIFPFLLTWPKNVGLFLMNWASSSFFELISFKISSLGLLIVHDCLLIVQSNFLSWLSHNCSIKLPLRYLHLGCYLYMGISYLFNTNFFQDIFIRHIACPWLSHNCSMKTSLKVSSLGLLHVNGRLIIVLLKLYSRYEGHQ